MPAAIGTLDPTFGTAGKVFQGSKPFEAVAAQTDGKVVAVASQSNDFVVVRYNADGTLDTTFGTGGIKTIDFALGGGDDDRASDVAIQPDGKIVVVGSASTTASGDDFAVARLNADGSLDTSFGTGGKVNVDFTGGGSKDDTASALAISATGDIFVVGTATNAGGNTSLGVAKLTANGAPAAFGNNGHEFLGVFGGTNDQGNGIAIQADGKVVAGTTDTNGNDFAVARIDPTTGALDPTFNTTGAKTINFGGTSDDQGLDVAVQADGKIVVVGSTDVNAGDLDAAVVRLTAAGALDTSFDTDGLKALGLGTPGDSANRVLTQADKIVLVGNTDGDLVVARLNQSNGALDTSFNGTGQVGLGVGSFQGNGGALAPGGKVVVAGRSNSSSDGVVARLIGSDAQPAARGGALSVGGSSGGTAGVFVPTADNKYTSPPTRTTPNTVFPGFTGEVRTATGDFDGDGVADTVLVTGPGTKTLMAVVSGKDGSILLQPTDPFGDANFTFGGFVTAGDIDGDGKAEWVVTPEQRGGPRVVVFGLAGGTAKVVANFFGIGDPGFRDGDRAALGDVNKDGVLDLFSSAAFNGGPRTALYDGKDLLVSAAQGRDPRKLVGDFFASVSGRDEGRGGRSIAAGDVNGDGFADFIVTGDNLLGTGNQVTVYSGADLSGGRLPGAGATPLANFAVGGQPGGSTVSVATVDLDGDARADVVVGSGAGQTAQIKAYYGKDVTGGAEPTNFTLAPFGGVALNGVFVG